MAGMERCIGDTVRVGTGRKDMGMDMDIMTSMGVEDTDITALKQLREAF